MISKLKIVEEESDESGYWLELLADSGTANLSLVGPLLAESIEIRKIISASVRTLRSK